MSTSDQFCSRQLFIEIKTIHNQTLIRTYYIFLNLTQYRIDSVRIEKINAVQL